VLRGLRRVSCLLGDVNRDGRELVVEETPSLMQRGRLRRGPPVVGRMAANSGRRSSVFVEPGTAALQSFAVSRTASRQYWDERTKIGTDAISSGLVYDVRRAGRVLRSVVCGMAKLWVPRGVREFCALQMSVWCALSRYGVVDGGINVRDAAVSLMVDVSPGDFQKCRGDFRVKFRLVTSSIAVTHQRLSSRDAGANARVA
jgi:hypothetical protein